jgi:hypothetical protein
MLLPGSHQALGDTDLLVVLQLYCSYDLIVLDVPDVLQVVDLDPPAGRRLYEVKAVEEWQRHKRAMHQMIGQWHVKVSLLWPVTFQVLFDHVWPNVFWSWGAQAGKGTQGLVGLCMPQDCSVLLVVSTSCGTECSSTGNSWAIANRKTLAISQTAIVGYWRADSEGWTGSTHCGAHCRSTCRH